MYSKKDAPDAYEYADLYRLAGKIGWGHPRKSLSERQQEIDEFDRMLDEKYEPSEMTKYLKKVARGEME